MIKSSDSTVQRQLWRLRDRGLISGGHPGSGNPIKYTEVDERIYRLYRWLRRDGMLGVQWSGGLGDKGAWRAFGFIVAHLRTIADQPVWLFFAPDTEVVGHGSDEKDMAGIVKQLLSKNKLVRVIPTAPWWDEPEDMVVIRKPPDQDFQVGEMK